MVRPMNGNGMRLDVPLIGQKQINIEFGEFFDADILAAVEASKGQLLMPAVQCQILRDLKHVKERLEAIERRSQGSNATDG